MPLSVATFGDALGDRLVAVCNGDENPGHSNKDEESEQEQDAAPSEEGEKRLVYISRLPQSSLASLAHLFQASMSPPKMLLTSTAIVAITQIIDATSKALMWKIFIQSQLAFMKS